MCSSDLSRFFRIYNWNSNMPLTSSRQMTRIREPQNILPFYFLLFIYLFIYLLSTSAYHMNLSPLQCSLFQYERTALLSRLHFSKQHLTWQHFSALHQPTLLRTVLHHSSRQFELTSKSEVWLTTPSSMTIYSRNSPRKIVWAAVERLDSIKSPSQEPTFTIK